MEISLASAASLKFYSGQTKKNEIAWPEAVPHETIEVVPNADVFTKLGTRNEFAAYRTRKNWPWRMKWKFCLAWDCNILWN